MTSVRNLLVEAWAVARSQGIASVMTFVTVAGMCATILLTTGRAEGARASLLEGIDEADSRTIVVRAQSEAGLDTRVLDRIRHIDGIAWYAGFDASVDVTNVRVPGRDPVSLRRVFGSDVSLALGVHNMGPPTVSRGSAVKLASKAAATRAAAETLGLADGIGAVADDTGVAYTVAGIIRDSPELAVLGPVVLVPSAVPARPRNLSMLVLVSERPQQVAAIAAVTNSVLGVDDPTKVTIETSERIADIRARVDRGFGSFGQNLLFVVFTLTALFVTAILYGTVMMRRKDFGRRRALGASQTFIFVLVEAQTVFVCLAAIAAADLTSLVALATLSDPLPSASFVCALNTLVLALSMISAALPAIAAARRDPLKELRVA